MCVLLPLFPILLLMNHLRSLFFIGIIEKLSLSTLDAIFTSWSVARIVIHQTRRLAWRWRGWLDDPNNSARAGGSEPETMRPPACTLYRSAASLEASSNYPNFPTMLAPFGPVRRKSMNRPYISPLARGRVGSGRVAASSVRLTSALCRGNYACRSLRRERNKKTNAIKRGGDRREGGEKIRLQLVPHK